MKTYSSISASRDTSVVARILKVLLIFVMTLLSVGIAFHFMTLGFIPGILIFANVITPSLYSIVKISQYSKREILELISPSGGGIKRTIRAYFSHPLDMIGVPAYIATVMYMYIEITDFDHYTGITVIVVLIYAVQMLPMMIKKEIFVRQSKKALNYVRDEFKITRIILADSSFTEKQKKQALNRHVAAEELMSVHSDYLVLSTGVAGTFIMVIRLMLPLVTGLGGQFIRPLLGG